MCCLTTSDDVIQNGFWVISKITSANLCQPIHDIINYSISICPFKSGEFGKKGKNHENLYLENEKSFLDEINIFHSFWRAIIAGKKIADTSFKQHYLNWIKGELKGADIIFKKACSLPKNLN